MTGFFIGVFTFFIIVDCLILVLLVLMQLPKKEAGAGLAFGGGATDALFGAGSGNFLTKTTKWVAIVFFVLAMLLSVLIARYYRSRSIFEAGSTPPASALPMAQPAAPPAS